MEREQEIVLVNHAKNDPEAFGRLFDHYYQPILRYVIRRTADVELAQDLTSETFFKALKKIHQFQWRKTSFGSWLYAIATNELRQFYRKQKRPTLSLDALQLDRGFDVPSDQDVHQELIDAQQVVDRHAMYLVVHHQLQQLPEHYQAVLALRFFESKRIAEIAEILGKKEGTVKSLLSRGLALLRANTLGLQPNPVPRILPNED